MLQALVGAAMCPAYCAALLSPLVIMPFADQPPGGERNGGSYYATPGKADVAIRVERSESLTS